MNQPDYRQYVKTGSVANEYLAYQERWADDLRESDRVLIEHVRAATADLPEAGRPDPLVIDIGCSTGNLLRHLRQAMPGLSLAGGEYSPEALAACRANPDLAGIPFAEMDVVNLDAEASYDVVIVNAVLYLMDDEDFASALAGLGRAICDGGTLLVFDFFHPFRHDLAIVERSRSQPAGLPLHFRPQDGVQALLRDAGFGDVRFEPFRIPIDLERGSTYTDNASGFEDLNSYTVRAESGDRLLFRGTLFQPWCHLVAVKAS